MTAAGSLPFGQTAQVLLVDAANVIGSRPDGWWRDRAGAARSFLERIRAAVRAGRLAGPVVVVLEGRARQGAEPGEEGRVTVLHAPAGGDDMLVSAIADADEEVTLVTADRGLRQRAVALGAAVASPRWLLEVLDGDVATPSRHG